jgi:large subunit ribosomal protein L24
MQRFHIKKGDEVVVISGTEKGKRGRVLQILPKKQRVLVEGAKIIKRHVKQRRDPNAPQGGIIEREGSIHISNVMKVADFDARAVRRGVKPEESQAEPAEAQEQKD